MKVTEVISVQNKTSKAGKPYTISTFKVEDNDEEIQAFGEAKIGMEVSDLQFNDTYHNWQAKLALPNRHEEVMTALRAIYKEVKKISGSDVHTPSTIKESPPSAADSVAEKAKKWKKPSIQSTVDDIFND